MRFLVPLEDNNELNSPISLHFGRAPYYAIVTVTVDGQVDLEVKSLMLEHGDQCGAYDLVDMYDVDAVVVRGIGPRAVSAFQSKGIKVFITKADNLNELIDEIRSNKLMRYSPELSECEHEAQISMRRRRPPYPYPPFIPPPPYPYSPQPQITLPKRTTREPGAIRVAIACQGRGGLDDFVSMRFGRAPTFTIVDIEDSEIKNVRVEPNRFIYQPHGVGVAVAQFMTNIGVNIAVAGRFGPNAMQVLQSLGIKLITVPPNITVKEALRQIS